MGMVVRTNATAIYANRQLNNNNNNVAKSLQKLSSGYKINSAADDASGLAISEKMKAQIVGLDQAAANSQDGISLIQTAEGATTQIHTMLNRMVELATKSANGTIQNEVDRDAIQQEVDQLNTEITRIAQSTNFNGINLLDGSLSKSANAAVASDVTTSLAYTTSAAVKGVYTASNTVATTLAANEKLSYTVALDNGDSYTVELTAKVKDGVNYLEDSEGNQYALTTASAAPTLTDTTNALVDALSDKLSGKFKVTGTVADGKLTFEAVNAGTAAPKVVGLASTKTAANGTTVAAGNKSDNANHLEATKAKDSTIDIADASVTAYTGSGSDNTRNSVFEINGQKFAVAASNVDVSQLDSDVTVLIGDSVADALKSTANQKLIETKTGATVERNATDNGIKLSSTTPNASGKGLVLQIGDTGDTFNKVSVSIDNLSAAGVGTAGIDVSTQGAASNSIDTIKAAINKTSTNRANLGALQNRLEYTIDNLSTTSENMTNANSAIRDTDMATEMMQYTQNNVLTQAAQAMLAQANQNPQSVLQLLQ